MSENEAEKTRAAIPANLQVGDIIKFGRYPQSDEQGNEFEEIEWRVLGIGTEMVLIISVMGLNAKSYNEEFKAITWEDCTLRAWLNDEFYNAAFNESEQAKIALTHVVNEDNPEYSTKGGSDTEDKIFLLSIAEAEKYFRDSEDRKLKPTKYAIANGAWMHPDTLGGWWWLRSPGGYQDFASSVDSIGDVYYDGTDVYFGVATAVHPALRMKLK